MKNKTRIIEAVYLIVICVTLGCFANENGTEKQGNKNNLKYISIASNLFKQWLESKGDLREYKINQIEFIVLKPEISEPRRSEIFDSTTTNDAFIVLINFSVKPKMINDANWIAGNGSTRKKGWIENKSVFIKIDKINGRFKIKSMGTSV